MALLLKFIFIGLLSLQASCNNDKKSQNFLIDSFNFENEDFSKLIQDLNDLEQAIALKQVLNVNSKNRIQKILAAINNARTGALTLAKFGEKDLQRLQDAYDIFSTAIAQYDSFGVLDFEQSRFDKVFNGVKSLQFLVAKKLGIASSYTWVLYNHNFADGIQPYFNMFSGKNLLNWVTNFQTDIPKAKVQGRSSFSWMVSKPFSLKGIKNPSFRYFTQLTVVAPNPKYSLNDVINKVFQTYIILDQLPGESPEEIEPSRKIRVNYNIDDLPLARNFHDAWVPKVSLEKYRGHKVSIAFLFDTRQIKETQYYIWDIFDVEIHGAGVFKGSASIYAANFNENLGGFKSLSLNFGGERWGKSKKGDLLVELGLATTDALILSPLYFVSENIDSLRLVLTETLIGRDFITAEIVVSTNYKGGVSPTSKGIVWEVLSSHNEPFNNKRSVFNLSKYKGESIVIGFRFTSHKGTNISWNIHSFYLETEGEDLTKIEYVVPDLDKKYIIVSYDLLSDAYKNFKKIYDDPKLSPKWQIRKDSGFIGGFVKGKPPLLGASRMVFPELDLSVATNIKIRITHGITHLRNPNVLRIQIRFSCAKIKGVCENPWENIVFPEGTFKDASRDLKMFSWVNIPDKFLNQKVETSIFYKGEKGNTPEWMVRSIDIGGFKQ